MTEEHMEITSYSLTRMYYSNLGAVIWLYSEDQPFARLEFRFEDNIQQPFKIRTDGILNIKYPIGAYSDIVDILRNETPAYLTFHRTAKYAYVNTGLEPAGEGEYRV